MLVHKKKIYPFLAIGLLVLLIGYSFVPTPISVEIASVTYGKLQITVNDDGVTRIKDRYVVSMPLAGRVLRIEMDPGDSVVAGKTVLAVVEPSIPQLLDARSSAQNQARVKAAEAALEQTISNLERAREANIFAKNEYTRAEQMIQNRIISKHDHENARLNLRTSTEDLRSAQFTIKIAEFELEQTRAAFIETQAIPSGKTVSSRFEIKSPINGKILRRLLESAVVVPAGTQLLELGDPENLEIITDVLSNDAVKINAGARMLVEHWGGSEPLEAVVRLIEPAAFTKISVLGVEEQRVWIVSDFVTPPENRRSLGEAYRVESRIIIWEGENVLKVPSSALFRIKGDWAVFKMQGNRAISTIIKLDHNNGIQAEVIEGLTEGDAVIVYPSDKVINGVKVNNASR